MKTLFRIFLLITILGLGTTIKAHDIDIIVKPYLQDATPSSIKVMWETSSGTESIVEWGETPKLGNKTTGKSYPVDYKKSRIHEVKLSGLKKSTTYYYKVITEHKDSNTYKFRTPPSTSESNNFNLLAMSDMQYDYKQPDKFKEIVDEGILAYLKDKYGKNQELSSNLAMIMIPGDLVENGTEIYQWRQHFFAPAAKLFSQVPVYPVLGNHERNSDFYFKYFSLPENGTPAYAEHWWYKDYGNVRIIGLDSNKGYREIPQQIEWLETVLKETAENKDIDFVFAQLHHPHKSELWIPGETDFTGKIIKLLEQFSQKTGKPSIHFFGHTHGYSRGQSKEHKHLWVNVASAGGAIDNWGEFEGRDYDEFTVTQDEYGFVIVEVSNDKKNPRFTLKRITRGNTKKNKDNEISDSITIYRKSQKPNTPQIISPQKENINNIGTILKATPFKSNIDGAFHAASQWQISEQKDFSKPIVDSWKQHENWYYNENRQKDDDLTDEKIERLKSNTTYFWRVRYRDQMLNWSKWSETGKFKTR